MTLSGGLTRWVDMAQEALEPASLGPELPGKFSRRSRSNFQDGFKGGRLETPRSRTHQGTLQEGCTPAFGVTCRNELSLIGINEELATMASYQLRNPEAENLQHHEACSPRYFSVPLVMPPLPSCCL